MYTLFSLLLTICCVSVILCSPQHRLNNRDDFFGQSSSDLDSSFFPNMSTFTRSFNRYMEQIARFFQDAFAKHMESFQKLKSRFDYGDILKNATVNKSESTSKQVGNNLITTNITHLNKVDEYGNKYNIVKKKVYVSPINKSDDVGSVVEVIEILQDSPKSPAKEYPHTDVNISGDDDGASESNHKFNTKVKIFDVDDTAVPASTRGPNVKNLDYDGLSTPASKHRINTNDKIVGSDSSSTPVSVHDSDTSLDTSQEVEKIGNNVMFDPKENLVITDLESNAIKH